MVAADWPPLHAAPCRGWAPRLAEAGVLGPFGWWLESLMFCNPLLPSSRACLRDAEASALEAAHWGAHAAGLLHLKAAKLAAQEAAARAAETADYARLARGESTLAKARRGPHWGGWWWWWWWGGGVSVVVGW